jgi:hypothetical protein
MVNEFEEIQFTENLNLRMNKFVWTINVFILMIEPITQKYSKRNFIYITIHITENSLNITRWNGGKKDYHQAVARVSRPISSIRTFHS